MTEPRIHRNWSYFLRHIGGVRGYRRYRKLGKQVEDVYEELLQALRARLTD